MYVYTRESHIKHKNSYLPNEYTIPKCVFNAVKACLYYVIFRPTFTSLFSLVIVKLGLA